MKNKTVNKKVLRAMSIGLAAMMTVQPILATPVFADDTEPVDDAGSSVEATAESSSAETTTESTSAPAPTVENVTQSYTEASNATGDIKDSLDQAVSAGRDSNEFAGFDQNNGGELTNLNKAVVGTEIGAVDAKTLNDNREDVSDAAIKLVEDAKRDDKKFEVDADELLELNGQVNKDINKIETAEKDLNDAINKQDEAINKIEITNDFTGTAGLINIETGYYIETATSIPSATEHLENATEYKKDADEKFEQSKADYDKAAADYETAKADLEAKQQAYNNALNAAVADDSALAKAKAELETAQKDCDNLVTEIEQAQDALSESAIGKLAAALAKTKENANDWSSLDLIMKDVIKYYYFPSIGVPAADVVIDAQFTKNSALADGTKNERANYIKATVGEKVYYLNYICEKDGTPDNKINNDGRYPKMVIFEKNPELIEDDHYEDGNSKYYDVTENAVEADENGVLSLDVDPVNGSYILNGTTYYVVNQSENVTVDNKLEGGDTAANTNTSYSLNENGDVVKTIKGDVTKTVIEGTSLVDSGANMTLKDAKDAAEECKSSSQVYVDSDKNKYKFVDDVLYKILENNELEKVTDDITVTAYQGVSDTYSVDASAKATVDFTSTFTTRVSLKGLRTEVRAIRTGRGERKEALQEINRKVFGDTESGFWHIIEEIFEDEKSKGVLGEIKNAINDAGYTVTGLSFDKVSLVEKIPDGSKRFNYYEAQNGSLSLTFIKKLTTKEEEGKYSQDNLLESEVSSINAKLNAENAAKTNAENNKAINADSKAKELELSNAVAQIIINAIKNSSAGKTYNFGELALSTDGSSTIEDKSKRTYDEAKVSKNGTATYGYNVNGTKVSKSYDTDATVSTAVFNTDELTYVDKKYAATPLLNDNYYNYKNGKSTNGILADLGKTNSEIYQKLMIDVDNANKLAAKYEDAKNKAVKAKEKVEIAQGKVDELIKSINALRANSGYEYEKKLAGLKAKLDEALENLNKATEEKKAVDEAYGRALEAYEDAVARLTPAPATGDEETAPTAGGGTTTAPAPAVVTTLAGTPVFALPAGGVAAPAAGVAGARTSRGAAIDSDSAAADTEDTTAKIAPTKEVEEDALAITKDTIKTIKDNETPLSSLTEDSTQKMNWWWLLLIALLGATGEEIYRRNKKKKEEEAALKAEIDKE